MKRVTVWRFVFIMYLLLSGPTLAAAFLHFVAGAADEGRIAVPYALLLILDVPWTPLIFMIVESLELTDDAFLSGSAICIVTNTFVLWGMGFSAKKRQFERAGL